MSESKCRWPNVPRRSASRPGRPRRSRCPPGLNRWPRQCANCALRISPASWRRRGRTALRCPDVAGESDGQPDVTHPACRWHAGAFRATGIPRRRTGTRRTPTPRPARCGRPRRRSAWTPQECRSSPPCLNSGLPNRVRRHPGACLVAPPQRSVRRGSRGGVGAAGSDRRPGEPGQRVRVRHPSGSWVPASMWPG